MNTSIVDKVTRSKSLPHNLQQCFEKALEYEASFQFSKGVNMAQKTAIMNVNVDKEEKVNFIKDAQARSNACLSVEKWDIFSLIANMMETNQPDSQCKDKQV